MSLTIGQYLDIYGQYLDIYFVKLNILLYYRK